jgi:polyphosphate glucokinase
VIWSSRYDFKVLQFAEDASDDILVFDIGASSIKYCRVSTNGELTERIRRRNTPVPCSPDDLLAFIVPRVLRYGVTYVVVGFPGECRAGVIRDCGNLAKESDALSSRNDDVAEQWVDFDLARALMTETKATVRVINDAALAGYGAIHGKNRELMVTLGTGMGVALFVNGVLQDIDDYGKKSFLMSSFDEVLGEAGREVDPEGWAKNVIIGLRQLQAEHHADEVIVGGGNGLRLTTTSLGEVGVPTGKVKNDAVYAGAARLLTSSTTL